MRFNIVYRHSSKHSQERENIYYSKLLTEHFIYMNIVGFKGFSFSAL